MIFADGFVALLLIGFLVFCLLDVITSDPGDIRNLPKLVWLLLIFINPIGGIAWLIAGRPQVSARPGGPPYKGNTGATVGFPERQRSRRSSLPPDDDPEFLAELKHGTKEHEKLLGSWEEDLRKREEELRRRERGEDDAG